MKRITLLFVLMFVLSLSLTNAYASVADDQVTSQKIREADGTSGQNTNSGSGVKTGHIQNGAITTTKIVDGAVTTNKIANGAVTAAKIGIVCPAGQYLQYTVPGGWVCSVGTAGPAGPQGPMGPAGPQGPAGPMPHYAKVAVVAQSGGDYTDPVIAMNDLATWCGGPSATNPCLVKIMPGLYTINTTLTMQAFVDIEGSGELVTTIGGAIDSVDGLVKGANNAEIRQLTVKNALPLPPQNGTVVRGIVTSQGSPVVSNVTVIASGGNTVVGIANEGSSPRLTNVTILSSDASWDSYGIFNYSSSPTITNVRATVRGGQVNEGLFNETNCDVTMNNSSFIVADGYNSNVGLFNNGSRARIANSIFSVSGGNYTWGVDNQSYADLTLTDVSISAFGGSQTNYGIRNFYGSAVLRIDHSAVAANTPVWAATDSVTYIGYTRLEGGPVYNTGGLLKCIGLYDVNYDPIACP